MKRFLFSLLLLLLVSPSWGQDYTSLLRKGEKALINSNYDAMIAFYRDAAKTAAEVHGEASVEHLLAQCWLVWGGVKSGDLKIRPLLHASLDKIRTISLQLPKNDAICQCLRAFAEGLLALYDGDVNKADAYAEQAYTLLLPFKQRLPEYFSMFCLLYGQCKDLARKDKSALSLFEQGLESLPDIDSELNQILAVCLYNNIGVSQSKLHNPTEAASAYSEARQLFNKYFPINNDIYLSFLNNEIASDLRAGKIDDAKQKCRRVFQGIQQGSGQSSWIYGYSLYFKAMILKAEGQINESIMTLREVNKSLYDNGWIDNNVRAAALRELSIMLASQGNMAESGRFSDEVSRINKKLLGEMADIAELEDSSYEANLATMSGNYQKALLILSDIVKKAEANPEIQPTYLGTYYGNLAVSLKNLEYYPEALVYGRKALDILKKAPGGERHYRRQAINHIDLCRILGLSDEAERLSKEIAHIEDNSREGLLGQAMLYLHMSEDASEAGSHLKALELSKKSVEAYEQAGAQYSRNYYIAILSAATQAYEANQLEEITPLSRKFFVSIKQFVRYQFCVMTDSERHSFWKEMDELVQIMMTSVFITNDFGSAGSQLFDAALLRKGILTMSSLDVERIISKSGDKGLLDSYLELRRMRGAIESNKEQSELVEQAQSLERSLMSKVSSYNEFLDNLTLGWKDIQSYLAPKDIAIEFVSSSYDSLAPVLGATVIRPGWKQPEFILFGMDEERAVETIINYRDVTEVRNAVVEDPDILYDLVWKPIQPYLEGVERIYFSPDESLHSLPLEYAFMPDGKPMCDHYHMERLSSTKELLKKTSPQGQGFVLFGGLDYDLSPDEMEYYAGIGKRGLSGSSWAYLPGSMQEIDKIRSLLGSKGSPVIIQSGADGVEETFKALDGTSPDIIHVATHGFFREGEQPVLQRCGLVFAGANNAPDGSIPKDVDDGLLTGEEIARLDLRGCRLAVLSACDTGLGDAGNEGISGLTQAFKRAGVDRLILSLWAVEDHYTQEFMTAFYRNLLSNDDIDTAFSSARTELRTSYSSPSIWASFVLLR